ncbi:allantoate amidohydrolase [Celerinatantimonas sp. MCCC 1A17872]|uniref:allantoate amidohydrolase n=1 Tax=Celerinatantimonas sp. MCCC 1A17872 TaxID=3177514 RepID=UPI0038CB4057
MDNNGHAKIIGERIYARCQKLAEFSESSDKLTRVYLSKEHAQCNRQVAQWMREAGMRTWQDEVGNLCARYEGQTDGAPALLLGSHLDTVRNGGKYDGIAGVLSAIEVVDRLHQLGIRLAFAIEVVGFADEEGTRFGSTLLGSRGLTGQWQPQWLQLQDSENITIAQALENFGLAPENIAQATRSADEFIGYMEVHIEQGPQLERAGLAAGVVSAINGAKRLQISITGKAGHAGTVPMNMRQDALVGASEIVLCIEQIAKEQQLVATVGQLHCSPGSVNVIPAAVQFSLDIRSSDDAHRDRVLAQILERASKIAASRYLEFSQHCFYQSDATECDSYLQQRLNDACEKVQGRSMTLSSGAGHDAMAIAQLCPVAMLFLRCEKGLSHHPDEAVIPGDLAIGWQVLYQSVQQLAADYESKRAVSDT